MRVKVIEFDDGGTPETLTVQMTRREAVFIDLLVGSYSADSLRKAGFERFLPEQGSIYDALSSVFNAYWEAGVEEVE